MALFYAVFMIIDHPSAFAWRVPIDISTPLDNDKRAYSRLVIGIEPDATEDYDPLWDAPAILSRPDPDTRALNAYIKGSWRATGERKYLWRDIRGTSGRGDVVWDLRIDSVPAGRPVTLTWSIRPGMFQKGERLVLRDNDTGGAEGRPVEVDVSLEERYTFVSAGEEARSLSLILSRTETEGTGSGSGFGCGTVKGGREGRGDGGSGIFNIFILFAPLFVFRLLNRLLQRPRGLSCKYI